MLTSLTHTNTHIQCLSASYCNDLKAISFVGFYWASVCLSLCLLADTHTHTDRALGSMGWLCLRPNVNQTTTDKHMLAWAHTRTHIICLSVWLLWTERPQLFSFQTKETIWCNIKHMVGYLMALCSDYKRGGRWWGKGRDGWRGHEEKKKYFHWWNYANSTKYSLILSREMKYQKWQKCKRKAKMDAFVLYFPLIINGLRVLRREIKEMRQGKCRLIFKLE